jgi:hypothetical protein
MAVSVSLTVGGTLPVGGRFSCEVKCAAQLAAFGG